MPTLRSLFWVTIPSLSIRLSQPPRDRHFLVLRLTLLLFTLSASVACPASLAGLVGFWNFDEDGGLIAKDSSGNSNAGILVNERQWITGTFGAALSFDGIDDYVEVPHSDSLNLTRELTISAWIYNQAEHEPSL